MKKLLLPLGVLALLSWPCSSRADTIDMELGTNYPFGSPLTIISGSTPSSNPMLINVSSSTNTLMSGWAIQLQIVPEGGASGTVTFADPAGPPAPNPPNYIFTDGSVYGAIQVTSNTGTTLGAEDLDLSLLTNTGPPYGVAVPTSGANLLQVDFNTSGASGFFDVFATLPLNQTLWDDSATDGQNFTNFTGTTLLIGQIDVTPSSTSVTPEPASLTLLLLGASGVGAVAWRRRSGLRKADGCAAA
jgi:hypothetical protein